MSAEPEIREVPLKPVESRNRCVLLVSEGVLDALSPEEIIAILESFYVFSNFTLERIFSNV